MLGLTKLSVIGVLAGTLGLVGCSEDAGGTGGTGGGPCMTILPSVAPACDNPDDLAAIAACEPDFGLATDCVVLHLPLPTNGPTEAECATASAACFLNGNEGASTPTTLSEECTSCATALACCITFQCSLLNGETPPGECVGLSGEGACDDCIAEKCTPAYESCGEGTGGTGGTVGTGGTGGAGGTGGVG